MGYDFTITDGVRVKTEGEYPWPCVSENNRTIHLWPEDVLTRSDDGTYMKHTGLGCFGIVLKEEEIENIEKPSHLRLL